MAQLLFLNLINNGYLYQKSKSLEAGVSDHHHRTVLKRNYEQMSPKIITSQSYKNFTEE